VKKWIGVLIIVQTVLFSMLIIQLNKMTETIAAVGSMIVTKDGNLAWGGGLPTTDYVLFGILIFLGVFLLIPEEKIKR